jgi:DNA-directed RNA polymerase specialized sigma24 family protein
LRTGDRIAWEYFADDYLPLLRGFARQACKNLDAGEDLAQEIGIVLLGKVRRLWMNRRPSLEDETVEPAASKGKLMTYNGRGSLAGWLRASVAHAAIDRFRRGTKQVSLDEMTAQGSEPCPSDAGQGARGEESLDARWGPVLSRALEQELSCLSAHDRLLLSLYYLEGIP